jgi:hypothetical protein
MLQKCDTRKNESYVRTREERFAFASEPCFVTDIVW